MNLFLIILAGIALLAVYVLVCWLLAFLRNLAVDLGDRALHALLAWIRRLRQWRSFTSAHAAEFAGPQFRWPATAEDWTKDVPW